MLKPKNCLTCFEIKIGDEYAVNRALRIAGLPVTTPTPTRAGRKNIAKIVHAKCHGWTHCGSGAGCGCGPCDVCGR